MTLPPIRPRSLFRTNYACVHVCWVCLVNTWGSLISVDHTHIAELIIARWIIWPATVIVFLEHWIAKCPPREFKCSWENNVYLGYLHYENIGWQFLPVTSYGSWTIKGGSIAENRRIRRVRYQSICDSLKCFARDSCAAKSRTCRTHRERERCRRGQKFCFRFPDNTIRSQQPVWATCRHRTGKHRCLWRRFPACSRRCSTPIEPANLSSRNSKGSRIWPSPVSAWVRKAPIGFTRR